MGAVGGGVSPPHTAVHICVCSIQQIYPSLEGMGSAHRTSWGSLGRWALLPAPAVCSPGCVLLSGHIAAHTPWSVPSLPMLPSWVLLCPAAELSVWQRHLQKQQACILAVLPALWTGNASGTCAADCGVCTSWREEQVEPDTPCWTMEPVRAVMPLPVETCVGLACIRALSSPEMPFAQKNWWFGFRGMAWLGAWLVLTPCAGEGQYSTR